MFEQIHDQNPSAFTVAWRGLPVWAQRIALVLFSGLLAILLFGFAIDPGAMVDVLGNGLVIFAVAVLGIVMIVVFVLGIFNPPSDTVVYEVDSTGRAREISRSPTPTPELDAAIEDGAKPLVSIILLVVLVGTIVAMIKTVVDALKTRAFSW